MTYISMNMVRVGVVKDPVEWKESGYFEIGETGMTGNAANIPTNRSHPSFNDL